MNWNAHPNLYQITHWWHWLTYGQNSAALQAVAAIVATLAAIAAGIFAAGAYRAARDQAAIAREQLRLSREESETAKARYAEEKERSRIESLETYLRMKAADDEARPRFAFTNGFMPNAGAQNWTIKNTGNSAATNLTAESAKDGSPLAHETFVAAGASFRLVTDPASFRDHGIRISFTTSFGSRWVVMLYLEKPEAEISAIRPYEPWRA